MKKKESNIIYIMKAFAVLSIVSAHCTISQWRGHSEFIQILKQIINYMGEFGVPVFLLLAGYLFHPKSTFLMFWKNKIKRIIIPWIFCSFLVYLYMYIQGDVYNLTKWLLGIGNVYWYMPVLILNFMLFYFFKNIRILMSVFVTSVIYHILAYDLNFFSLLKSITIIGPVFQFMPYFVFGMLLNNSIIKEKILKIVNKKRILFCLFTIMIVLVCYSYHVWGEINYRSPLFLLFSFCGIVMVYRISLSIESLLNINELLYKQIIKVGKDSFTIYLVHLPFAGIISNLLSRNIVTVSLVVFYPVIIIACIEFLLLLLRKICSKCDNYLLIELIGGKNEKERAKR